MPRFDRNFHPATKYLRSTGLRLACPVAGLLQSAVLDPGRSTVRTVRATRIRSGEWC